jgi:hypothetical protein
MGLGSAINAVIGGDTAPLQAAGQRVEQITNKINGVLGSIGVSLSGLAAVGAFVQLGKGAIELAGRLTDTALNIGINVESLQALEAQHKRNGVSQEALTKALEKTREAGIAAFNGEKKQVEALGALGINAQYFIRLPLDKQYALVATAVAHAADKNVAYNAVADLFGGKIGPKLMASLTELGTMGLPRVTAEAKALGQVMSAETIAALDKAGDAIDDFKKAATVKVGNIMINFRTTEGLVLMGYQLLSVAAGFGGKILDVIAQANDMLKAVLKGTLIGLGKTFLDSFIESIKQIGAAINVILPKKYELNVAGLDKFKSDGEGVVDSIARAISETEPTTFQKDFEAFYDQLAKEQQHVVDNLNRVDFAKPAGDLKKAGNDFVNSGNKAADAMTGAAEKIKSAAEILAEKTAAAAAKFAGVFKTTGRDDSDLSDRELQEKIDAVSKNVFDRQLNNRNSFGGVGSAGQGPYDPFLVIENQNLQNALTELKIRDDAKRIAGTLGEDAAAKYTGLSDSKLASILGTLSDNDKVVEQLKELNTSLKNGTAQVRNVPLSK